MRIIIASNNEGKVEEFRQILSPLGYDVVSQSDAGIDVVPDENGCTFEENAAIKARAVYGLAKGCAVAADDSGLEVEALGGEPGVYSARYGGSSCKTAADRNALVLSKLKGQSNRRARFAAVIHFISSGGEEISVRGECAGEIAKLPAGEGGFGYDPIFLYGDRTFGEHPQELKNLVSHRARALKKLVEALSGMDCD